MENLFENFTVSILKLNKLVHKIKLYEMEEYGLKAIHVMCVYYLARSEEGLTSKDLVKATLEDKAAISRALSLLCQKGAVTYDSHKYNSVARLTDFGKTVAEGIDRKAERAVSAGMDGSLDEESRKAFYTSLSQISRNLEKYYGELTASKAGGGN